jgi:hypothetical protein
MRYGIRVALSISALMTTCTACGGSHPEPKDANDAPAKAAAPAPEEKSDVTAEPSSSDSTESKPSADERAAKTESSTGAEPTFPDGASVDQAMAAVPKGTARANIDADRLAEPLQQESVYEPCKVGSQHFKVRVAVWGGKAVGVDVTTPNKKLAECIDKQVRGLTWPDKVRSLNTVEFSF